MLVLDISYMIYMKFEEYPNALQIALSLDNTQYVKQVFTSCADLLRKKQFCYSDSQDSTSPCLASSLSLPGDLSLSDLLPTFESTSWPWTLTTVLDIKSFIGKRMWLAVAEKNPVCSAVAKKNPESTCMAGVISLAILSIQSVRVRKPLLTI